MGSWTLNKLGNSKNIQILITALHVQNPSDDFYDKTYYSVVPQVYEILSGGELPYIGWWGCAEI